jgi:hypothetical protein
MGESWHSIRVKGPEKGRFRFGGTEDKEFQEWCGQGVLGLRSRAGTSGAVSWRGTAWPRWRRYVPLKRRVQLYGLHGVISQKMILFKTTAVKTSNPTFLLQLQRLIGKFSKRDVFKSQPSSVRGEVHVSNKCLVLFLSPKPSTISVLSDAHIWLPNLISVQYKFFTIYFNKI